MRSDYALYVVAIICFIAAAYTVIISTEVQLYISLLAILGIIFIGLGYMARPKKTTVALPKPATPKPAPSSSPPELLSKTVQPKTELKEEPKKTSTKKRARKKRTTRRRKKQT